MPNPDTRLDELEVRLSHQEKTIADLSDVIAAQWKKIDMLERKLHGLSEDLQSLSASEVPVTKPPHY